MNSEKFLASIELNLTPIAPEFMPGIIKKQMENLDISYKGMTPDNARLFITNVADALSIFIGPERSNNARKFMMKKLRECCSENEMDLLTAY
ncbi:MAG: hypothetical protein JSV49_12580 [Thermoplasmata archaeon]|nr:MAG: hypothetical protein JSV49_12580 [Thermoplasmata archaeon]